MYSYIIFYLVKYSVSDMCADRSEPQSILVLKSGLFESLLENATLHSNAISRESAFLCVVLESFVSFGDWMSMSVCGKYRLNKRFVKVEFQRIDGTVEKIGVETFRIKQTSE